MKEVSEGKERKIEELKNELAEMRREKESQGLKIELL